MELKETFQKVKTASKTLSLLSDDQRNETRQWNEKMWNLQSRPTRACGLKPKSAENMPILLRHAPHGRVD